MFERRSKMKVLCVDIQGFTLTPNNDFFAKEIAITNGRQSSHYLFEMPIKYSSLSEDDRRRVKYATFKVHGLLYGSNDHIEYSKISSIILQEICDADIVYVRGHQKKEFLDNLLLNLNERHLPKISNIETLDEWFTSNATLYADIPTCMGHLNDKKKYMCSLRNCFVIHNWIANYCMTF